MRATPMIGILALAAAGACLTAWDPTMNNGGNAGIPPELLVDRGGPRKPWTPVGRMDISLIKESSGIVKSRQYPGVYWTHSDSANPAELFAITEQGEIVARVPVDAPNVDWEDIAADEAGNLYIADIGNNFGWFRSRQVYRVAEPDPGAGVAAPLHPDKVFAFQYPGERFDAEGLFVHDGRLFLVSKAQDEPTVVYRLEEGTAGSYALHALTQLPPLGVTGAEVSSDGSRLALCTRRGLLIYSLDESMVPVEDVDPQLVRYPGGPVEACCFDGDDVILTSESGQIYRITADDIASQTAFVTLNVKP